jgi:hypothetical protein
MVAVALTVAMPDRLVAFAGLVMQIFTVYLPDDGLLEAHPIVAARTLIGALKFDRVSARLMTRIERIRKVFIQSSFFSLQAGGRLG